MQLIEESSETRSHAQAGRTRVQPNVIDMVAVLQQSLQRASLKQNIKRSNRLAKSTSALVKRRRRSVAA